MWSQVLSSPTEQSAFTSLLEEYFSRPPPIPSTVAPVASPRRHLPPQQPTSSNPLRPSSLISHPPTSSSQSLSTAPTSSESFSSRLQTSAASAALRNTTATSSALRQAGFSQSAANELAGFGAKNHEKLAPHLASAARTGIRMQQQQQNGQGQEEGGGVRTPGGLMSSKSMVGVGDTSSGKSFTKALFSSKGALSKTEQDKNKYTGPLYVKPPTAPGTISHAPPPRRGVGGTTVQTSAGGTGGGNGEEKVRALYDYEGGEVEDLPVVENEVLTVIERVGDDWLRCRNERGGEGILPKNYTEPI